VVEDHSTSCPFTVSQHPPHTGELRSSAA